MLARVNSVEQETLIYRNIRRRNMKVLFLDIDGVINCKTSNFKTDLWPLDRYMAFLVGKIEMYTDCKVVLSSSWRKHPEGVAIVEKSLAIKLFDITGNEGKIRGDEIQAWLERHPEVTRYAILDDDSDMLESQLPNFFQTKWETGLTDEIAEKVISHLNEGV